MSGVTYTKQRTAGMSFAALVDPAAAMPMCHHTALGSVNPWDGGSFGTAGLTAKRSARHLRRSPT